MEHINKQEHLKELEDMRRQMAELKTTLDKQTIINDRMLRRVMRSNSSWIRRRYILCMAACVLLVPYCYFFMIHLFNFSMYLWIFTSIFMLTAAIYTYYNMRALNRNFMSEDNLVEAGREIARAMKMDADWLKIGIPFLIIWIFWMSMEAMPRPDFTPFIISVGTGGSIGAIVGLATHRKIQRKYRDIVEQIESITLN